MFEMILMVVSGIPLTLIVTAVAFISGAVLGYPLMLGLTSEWWVSKVCRMAVDLIRGVPPVVWLFLIYYAVTINGTHLSPFMASVVGLGLISAAYLAEIFRGAMKALPIGQREAGYALGLSSQTVYSAVLLPQMLRNAFPAAINFLINLVKDSSLASTIGVTEMVYQASVYTRKNMATAGFMPFFFAAAVYLVVSALLGVLGRWFEQRYLRRGVS
jgi:polar amino acid transport system permease protein/cystine transport system permease protein